MQAIDPLTSGYCLANPPRMAGTPAGEYLCSLLRGNAHKQNNLLSVIQGFTGLLLMDDGLDGELRESIDHIRKAAERAGELPALILAAAGCIRISTQPVRLDEFLPLIDAGLRAPFVERNVPLTIDIDPAVPPVSIDGGRFRDILNILLRNAAEAADAAPGPRSASLGIAPPGRVPESRPDHVDIHVRNTGHPIPPDRLRDVFQPFVSTRDSSHSGLGLSVAAMLASQMRIALGVKSTAEETTFWLSVPVA